MSDWISELKQSEKDASSAANIQNELAVYQERRYRELIQDWWDALVTRLESDSQRLDKGIDTKKTNVPSLQLQRTGYRTACIAIRLLKDACQIRAAYSHSDQGIAYQPDRVEKFQLGIVGNDLSVIGESDLSRYLLTKLIEESEKR